MSILKNHAEALTKAADMSLKELEQILGPREPAAGCIIAAVSNSDTCRVKEQLFLSDPAGIVAGLTAYIRLTGAKGAQIITLAEVDAGMYEKLASEAGIALTIRQEGMVIRTEHREDLHVLPDELLTAAMAITGETGGILLAVNDGELFEADPEETLWDAVGKQTGDLSSCKAFLTDHAFYKPSAFQNMKVKDLPNRSGVITVLNEDTCLVERAGQELMTLREKSCGRCTFCREGLIQLSGRIAQVQEGRAKGAGMDLAEEIAEAMQLSGHCTLGEDAPLPVLTLIRDFPEEIDAHIRRGECPAGVCRAYCRYYIDPAVCTGTGSCVNACPVGAIETKPGYTSVIDVYACTGCGKCLKTCSDDAIHYTYRKPPKNTDIPQRLKRSAERQTAVDAAAVEEKENQTAQQRSGRRKRTFAKPVKK